MKDSGRAWSASKMGRSMVTRLHGSPVRHRSAVQMVFFTTDLAARGRPGLIGSALLFPLNEVQGSRVHAIPQMGGRRAVVENVPQMGVAPGAIHFGPAHPKAHIGGIVEVLLRVPRP